MLRRAGPSELHIFPPSGKWREFLEADFFSPEPDLQPGEARRLGVTMELLKFRASFYARP